MRGVFYRAVLFAALAAALVISVAGSVLAAGRNALVIGNSSYRPGYELRNPIADARGIADSLAAVGFEIVLLEDVDLASIQRALDAFVPKAIRSEVAVIYYAGHGASITGRSFLLPVDFAMAGFENVDKEAFDTDRLVQALDSTHADLKLLMFDACRNNPLEDRGAKPLNESQAKPKMAANTLTIFATAQGRTALDGTGDHSPFAEGMMTNIERPEIELAELVRQVTGFVRDKTQGRQAVWVNGTVDRAFYLGSYSGLPGRIAGFALPEPEPGLSLVFPNSDMVLLTTADLQNKDAATLRLARNEIFARRGKIFSDQGLTRHFSQFAWYKPMLAEPALNAVEQQNVELIREYELRVAAPSNGFIFLDSDRRLLTSEEVAPLDKQQLRIARNEIYARRGRKFKIAEVRDYFEQFDWYDPRFGEVELTYVEQRNVDLIRGFEQ